MATTTVKEALENIYASLHNDNEEIDERIDILKAAMKAEGQKEAVIEPAKLAQNNRQGRKMMESYFRKRGVNIVFSKE